MQKQLENKTFDQFKRWVKKEMVEEDKRMTQSHKEKAMAEKQGEHK